MMDTSPLVLGIDTALQGMSLSLVRGKEEIAGFRSTERNNQASLLIPAIEKLLAEQALWYDQLHGFAVTTGPGAFTGIRIGLGTARMLAFAAKKQIAGFSTLEIMACPDSVCLSIIPSGRNAVFVQSFKNGRPAGTYAEPEVITLDRLKETVTPVYGAICSASEIIKLLPKHIHYKQHDILNNAKLCAQKAATKGFDAAQPPFPLYIRPPDAKPQTPFLSPSKPNI